MNSAVMNRQQLVDQNPVFLRSTFHDLFCLIVAFADEEIYPLEQWLDLSLISVGSTTRVVD